MRQLKHHEKKLLKKVDFYNWKTDGTARENNILRRYYIQKREDYTKYNKLCGLVRKVANKLMDLDPHDDFRVKTTDALLDKLFSLGLISTKKSLKQLAELNASSFCRRRLPVIMVRLHMSENLKQAVTYIEQGHVRVGPNTVDDPAFLVTRTMEDFVTWVDNSKIKQHVLRYHDKLDDFDLLGN